MAVMITTSLLPGVTVFCGKNAEGSTPVLVKLSSAHRMIETGVDGKIQPIDRFQNKHMNINGDWKTHECVELFHSLSQEYLLFPEATSVTANITLDVFDHTRVAPDNW